jgi:NAD(P)-dependent dehydrogenase (short-subunit alcohol dehydrogenase family)
MSRLAGKRVVITGGAGNIGVAAAALFAGEGAQVLLVDRSEPLLQEAVAAIGSPAVDWVVADVTEPAQVEQYVEQAVARLGGVDVFLANAAIEGAIKPIVDYPVDLFDQVMAVNVRGVWLGLKYVIPVMGQHGGSIIITSSIAGVKGSLNLSGYVASKHAVIGIMRTAALECAPLGIRVNTVNPGPTETRMMRAIDEQRFAGAPEQGRERSLQRIPLRRYGTPEDVARLMLFLASDESRNCTGGVYMTDGGGSA